MKLFMVIIIKKEEIEALSLYPKPEIFNTDQGSQYTSKAHVIR